MIYSDEIVAINQPLHGKVQTYRLIIKRTRMLSATSMGSSRMMLLEDTHFRIKGVSDAI